MRAAMKSRREEYSETTREALIDAGRDLFVKDGYQNVSVEQIVRLARVTRGAFYHHFADRAALFDALIVRLQAGAAERIVAKVGNVSDRARRLRLGVDVFLEICCERSYRRLVIEEAPSVLGAKRCRKIEDGSTIGLMVNAMAELDCEGLLQVEDPALAARMIASMICQVALLLADAPDRARMRRAAGAILDRVLAAIRRS